MNVGEVVVDQKGRVVIPAELRRRLGLGPGRRLRVELVDEGILLVPLLPKPRTVRAGRRWGEEAFLDAGEATFGEEGVGC